MFVLFEFADEADNFGKEKEEMMKSEDNSETWSGDDTPPILIMSQTNIQKLEPLLKPLSYKPSQDFKI